MSKDQLEKKLSDIEKELLEMAKPRHVSQFDVRISSGLRVIRYSSEATSETSGVIVSQELRDSLDCSDTGPPLSLSQTSWQNTQFHPDSGERGRQDAARFDVLAESIAVIASLPGEGGPRERCFGGLEAHLRAGGSGDLRILEYEDGSLHSVEMFDLARTLANYVRALMTERHDAANEFTLTGMRGTLRRGENGFAALLFIEGQDRLSQFSLNPTEERVVEKLWKAAKDDTKTVHKRHLLEAAKKDPTSPQQYESVSKAFTSKDGKAFYKEVIQKDNSGNYWLGLEKI